MTAMQTSAPSAVESLLGQILDDFLNRQGRGEEPDVETYAQRYPQLATVLRQMLPALQVIQSSAGDLATAADPSAPLGYVPGYLGDFRILREVGRGGMGIVYEVEQVSLNRRVALKVLPFAAALDPKQLQRFKNEAQAAGQLHHPNIVPVYGVGCERGVHYYAMQYIEGQTLAAIIRELRGEREGINPVSTNAARLEMLPPLVSPPEATPAVGVLSTEGSTRQPGYFRTVARLGVQAAEALEHAHQLGIVHRDIKPANVLVDVRGHLWITDFGLARVQSDAGLTLSGDLLGTLRYMSPEQALAKHGLVDHRTDIYALGVTLYELLTLEPVCPGEGRLEVLWQIERKEPRPPRQLNAAIPADLETIVLKAVAKEPDGRYATAQELAEDLKRFLDNKPIRAKRPTLIERARKWSRRHQGVVVTAGVAVVVLLATVITALAVGIHRVRQEQQETEKERRAALVAQEQAEENYRSAKESYRLARDGLEKVVKAVTDDPRLKKGELADVLRAVRTAEASFYHQFVELRRNDPDFQEERATTLRELARITEVLGTREDAIVHFSRAREIFAALAHDHPAVLRYQALLAKTDHELGVMYSQTARWKEAEQALQQALDLQRMVVSGPAAVPNDRAALASTQSAMGSLYAQTGRLAEAEAIYEEALRLRQDLIQGCPTDVDGQAGLAASYHQLGTLCMKTGRLPKAEQLLQKALMLEKALVTAYPDRPGYRAAVASSSNNLCYVYERTNRLRKAEKALQKAVAERQILVRDYPFVTKYKVDLGGTQCNLARLAHQNGDREACLDWLSLSITTLEAVRDKEPNHAAAREFLGNAYQGRYQLLNQMRRHAESLHDLNQLLKLREGSPGRHAFRLDRAVTLARLQKHAEATAEAEDLLRLGKSDTAWLFKLAQVYALSVAAPDVDRLQAEPYAGRAVWLLRQAAAKGYQDVEALIKRYRLRCRAPTPKLPDGVARFGRWE
jgi:serine/threonine protein kinase